MAHTGTEIVDQHRQKSKESDGDINEQINIMVKEFTETELKEMTETLQSDQVFAMNWIKVIQCIKHEMWPKFASIIKGILNNDKNGIDTDRLKKQDMDKVIDKLKDKNIGLEAINYLKQLMQRALCFEPFNVSNAKDILTMNEDDFDPKHRGLNPSLLLDIFTVYKCYRFTKFHFNDYTMNEFQRDLIRRGTEFIGAQFTKKYLNNIALNIECNMYPQYLVDDSISAIFRYHFAASFYVHHLKTILDIPTSFQINVVVIPRMVSCVYDENVIYKYTIHHPITRYLESKNMYNFIVFRIRKDEMGDVVAISDKIMQHYDTKDVEIEKTTKLLIIVDRRDKHYDEIYIIQHAKMRSVSELSINYFISFEYRIRRETEGNAVSVYFCYGMRQRIRFYPEILTDFIPRIFKKPDDISMANYLKMLYSNDFKHGFNVVITDQVFDKYFKMFCGVTNVSVNYNRRLLKDDFREIPMLYFREIMDHEMKSRDIASRDIVEMNEFFRSNEYESDSILFDIEKEWHIKQYFESKGRDKDFLIIKDLVKSYYGPSEKDKKCGSKQVKSLKDCEFIQDIIIALKEHNEHNTFESNKGSFNVSKLLAAHDHIVCVHRFLRATRNEEDEDDNDDDNKEDVVQYIMNEVGQCMARDCNILHRHIMRRREIKDDDDDKEAEQGLDEIIKATLNALHAQCLHKQQELYRLRRNKGNTDFEEMKLECVGDKCAGKQINCPLYGACHVKCYGKESCTGTTFNWQDHMQHSLQWLNDRKTDL